MRNNRRKVIAKTAQDLYFDKINANTDLQQTKDSIKEQFASIFKDKTYTVLGENNVLTSTNRFYRDAKDRPVKSPELKNAIEQIHKSKFFDVITGKEQSGSELISKTIDLNNKLNQSNQKVKANSSLTSVQSAFENFKNLQKNSGKFHVYDLETIGGDNKYNIWSPIGITEFSVHTKDFGTGGITKTDVFLGMSESDAKKLKEDIFKAIDNGTLDQDKDLRVSAMRMSMYGNEKTSMDLTPDGYFKITNFVDGDEAQITNKKLIEKGIDRHVEAYNKTKLVDGIKVSEKVVMDKIAEVNNDLANKKAMIAGFNDTLFDAPIVNKYLQDIVKKNTNIIETSTNKDEIAIAKNTLDHFNNLFNGRPVFSPQAEQHMDMRSVVDLFRGYYGVDAVYGGKKDILNTAGGRMLRQEHIAGTHLEQKMKNGVAHVASFDVEMLMSLFLDNSEVVDMPFIDYMMRGDGDYIKGLNAIQEVGGKIKVGDQIYKARKTSKDTNFSKQGHLNFMYDRKNDTYHTASGYTINKSGIKEKNFDLGTKANKNQFYKIGGVQKIEANSEWGQMISGVLPELSTQDLFALQMDIQVGNELQDSVLADTSRYFFFKTQDELEAFVSSNFLKVAERNDAGEMAIIKSKEVMKELEIRKLTENKNGTVGMVLEKGFWNKPDREILEANITKENKKLLSSRAENAVFGDNSFKKITQELKIKNAVEKALGENVSGTELAQIMSGKVVSEKVLGKIDNKGLSDLQKEITRIAGYKKELLPTTQTSLSIAYDTIGYQSEALSTIHRQLIENNKLSGGTEAKQLIFDSVLKDLKMEHAKQYYGDNPTKIRNAIFNNKQALMSTSELENFYEIDLSSMAKKSNEAILDIAKPNSSKNIARINLEHGKEYNFLDKLINMKYGNIDIDPSKKEAYELDAVNDFLDIMKKERPRGKNVTRYKEFDEIDNLKNEIKEAISKKEKINPHEITSRLFENMRSLKQSNPTLGILNTEATMSALFNVDKKLLEDFNSYVTPDKVNQAIKKAPNIISFKNDKQVKSFVKDNLMQHYMPSYKDFIDSKKTINKDQERMLSNLYENIRSGHEKNLTEIIQASTSAGAKVSVQNDGTLVLFKNGEYQVLDRVAKTKLHKESGVLYHQVGQQKVVANGKVSMHMKGGRADVRLTSNLEDINNSMYSLVNTIKKKYKNGTFELSDIAWSQSKIAQSLIENSSLQTFNPHDMKSNYRLDFNDIKNILPDLFNKDGQLRSEMEEIAKNGGFRDRDLIKTVEEALNGRSEIDELAPTLKHAIVKNMQDIVLSVAKENDHDLKQIVKSANASSKENQIAELVLHVGDRYQNSPTNVFDANNRPTIAQAGRARYIKKENVKNAIKANKNQVLFEGSIITSQTAKEEMFREVEGIGEMMTNISFRRRFVGSDSLKVILDTKFDEVIKNAEVGKLQKHHIQKMYAQLYDTMNTFEQEKHMDSRVFEKTFGRAADVQRLSVGADIVKPLENKVLDDVGIQKYKELISMIGDISLDESGDLAYKGHIGKLVNKGDKIVDYASFGDTTKAWSSKIHKGILNYGFFSQTDHQQLDDKGISNIINKHKSKFIDEAGNIKSDFRSILVDIFEKENFVSQYFIEDVNRLSYAKLMDDQVEKGMTKIDYVKLGEIDENIAKTFERLGQKDLVKNSVLTNKAFDVVMNEASQTTDVNKVLKDMGYKGVSDLRAAVNRERHYRSELIYDYIFPGVTEIANDALAKHGNKGSMMQGVFGELVMATSKSKGISRQQSLELILDKMKDDRFNFLESVKIGSEIKNTALGMRAENGSLEVLHGFATDAKVAGSIDHEKFANLIRHMDKELNLTGDDKLVHHNVKVFEEGANGGVTTKEVKEYLGRAQFMDVKVNGKEEKHVLISADSIVSASLMDDPETQTGVSQAFFDKRLEMVKAKKMYHQTGEVKYLAKAQELQGELAGFNDVVKQMGISDQEIAIMEIAELSDASVKKLKKINTNDFLETDALKGVFVDDGNGGMKLRDDLKDKKVLKHFTEQYKDLVLYDPTTEIELTKDMLKQEKYGHLKGQFELAEKQGRRIGVDTAQKFKDLNMANMAYEFDSNIAKANSVEHLLDNGFEGVHINDFINNHGTKSDIIDSLANKHLLIDLGEEFDRGSRHIALPGLGSIIGDDEVRTEYQKKLIGLSNNVLDYNYQLTQHDSTHDEVVKARQRVVDKSEEIKELVGDIYGKNKAIHEATKAKVVAPSYRLKASGANGIYDTGVEAAIDDSQALKMWSVKNQTALAKAEINGKSIMDWEKEGVYFDYKFMSKDQFKEMGYYDKDYMAKLGIKSESDMTKYLKTQGSLDISDRYPNISATSLVTTRTYLDETLSANQTKVSRVTTLKYNGDFDGDSTSAHLLRVRNENSKGEYFWEDYAQYNKARLEAKSQLKGLDTPPSEEQIRNIATNGKGVSVTQKTYDEFKSIDAYMALEAAGDNSNIWAKKVEETMAKDSIKTAKNLQVDSIASVEGGQSILGKKLFTQLSEHVDLKAFNENEEAVNKGLEEIAKHTGAKPQTVRELDDVGKGLDNALVQMKGMLDNGVVTKDVFNEFQEAAVQRYRIDKTVQETMSKAGKGTIGSINVQLASVRQAAQSVYGGTGPDRDIFKSNLVLEINRAKEQEIISSKKMIVDYDENRITEYGNIARKIFKGRSNGDLIEGKEELAGWMDTYMRKSDFTKFYDDNVGVHISQAQHSQVAKNLTGQALEDAKYKFVRDEYIGAVSDLSQNKLAKSYMDMFSSVGKSGDKYTTRLGSAMAVGQSDTMTSIAMGQVKTDLYDRGVNESTTYLQHRAVMNNRRNMESGESSSSLQATKHALTDAAEALGGGIGKGISRISGSGLAMAVLGSAAGLMVSGYAAGNPLKEANAQEISQDQSQPQPPANSPMSIPSFLDEQGGYVTGNSQRGYIINIKADTKKGRKHMERMMKEAAQSSVGGAVSINMNIRNSKKQNFNDQDIEKYIENHL